MASSEKQSNHTYDGTSNKPSNWQRGRLADLAGPPTKVYDGGNSDPDIFLGTGIVERISLHR
jgi:hypothetical protein